MPLTSQAVKAFLDALGQDACIFDQGLMPAYSGDNSKRTQLPVAVFFPKSDQDVIKIVTLCRQYKLPITARGLGSGTPGGAVPLKNGVVVCFSSMNRILEINPLDRSITVEPGVTNQEVQNAAKAHQLFWPPNPSSQAYATVGGNLAYNSAGPSAVKYGSCRDYVLGLTAVTGAGDAIKVGCNTTKGVVGYDLTRLIIGSEGTLALITKATLKLLPLIENRLTFQVFFQNSHDACALIQQLLLIPQCPIALEMMDENALALIASPDLKTPSHARALLMIEYELNQETTLEALQNKILSIIQKSGAIHVEASSCPTEAQKLWALRKALSPNMRRVAPNKINEDVVVPVSQLSALLTFTHALNESLPIQILCFGHAGNGNMHVNLLYDQQDAKQEQAAKKALKQIFNHVLALGGTLSGEHGVGLDKVPFVAEELSAATLSLMKALKKVFDPDLILNPDKLFPDI